MRMKKELMVFRHFYRLLNREGMCDGVGGMEYKRVRNEWIRHGRLRG